MHAMQMLLRQPPLQQLRGETEVLYGPSDSRAPTSAKLNSTGGGAHPPHVQGSYGLLIRNRVLVETQLLRRQNGASFLARCLGANIATRQTLNTSHSTLRAPCIFLQALRRVLKSSGSESVLLSNELSSCIQSQAKLAQRSSRFEMPRC